MGKERNYRMPDGSYTSSGNKVARAWDGLSTPFCKATGCEAIGYDPGVRFRATNDAAYSSTFDIPVSVLVKLNKFLDKREKK